MPRRHRLTHADLSRLSRTKGKRLHGELFSLLVAPLPTGKGPKTASVVSKKISPKAVERNAIDRKVRETMRSFLFVLDPASAFVLYAKPGARGAALADVRMDIERLLKKAATR